MNTFIFRSLLIATGLVGLSACVTIPKNLSGKFSAITPQQAGTGSLSGTQVRWGGQIIRTLPAQGDTCFYVLGKPLNKSNARPVPRGDSVGRFIACKTGFFDPEVYAKGRDLTVTGILHGVVTQKVGNYEYPYPRIEAATVHLWSPRPRYQHIDNNWGWNGYNPYWGWGPYFSPWWYGSYWGSPVYFVPHAKPSSPTKK